jgi:phosphatidylserine/phosphatidylglycerophosphate/cardiolipin synthase-like enzyme
MYSRIRPAVLVAILTLVTSSIAAPQRAPRSPAKSYDTKIEVLFSPRGGCTDRIIAQLNGAERSIDIQAYSFTSAPIAKAVVDAHKRGVRVRAVLDKSQRTARYTSATFLFNAGVPTYIDSSHAIAHNKIILIDGETILTGSFNFTKAAEQSNAENLLILTGHPELMQQYQANFNEHFEHASRYEGLDHGGKDDSSANGK